MTLVSPLMKCPTQRGIQQRRLSWVPLTILTLAVYATILSGIYLVIALVRPRYGRAIGEDGAVVPATATLLSALFAKTIELAYVTVCVAFLGQVLSRRALTQGSRGITISDMSMRSWIMQPGALIVHWETLRYSAATVLGAITLTATVVAMLYTTAAEALGKFFRCLGLASCARSNAVLQYPPSCGWDRCSSVCWRAMCPLLLPIHSILPIRVQR